MNNRSRNNLELFYDDEDIDREHLSVVVHLLGTKILLQRLNNSIQKEGYEIAFAFTNVIETLNQKDYQDLRLEFHSMEIPSEESNGKSFDEIIEGLDVCGFNVLALDQQYLSFSFGKGSAECIEQIITNVNRVLIPEIERRVAKLNLKGYKVTFKISKGY